MDTTTQPGDLLAPAVLSAVALERDALDELDEDEQQAWAAFKRWCDRGGVDAMPATAATVGAYLLSIDPGAARDCSEDAISVMHLRSGHRDPLAALES